MCAVYHVASKFVLSGISWDGSAYPYTVAGGGGARVLLTAGVEEPRGTGMSERVLPFLVEWNTFLIRD